MRVALIALLFALPGQGEPIKAIELFKDYVAKPKKEKLKAAREAALEEAKTNRRIKPVLIAMATVLRISERNAGFPGSEERKALLEILKKHDPAKFPRSPDAVVADTIAAIPKRNYGALRTWALAHLSKVPFDKAKKFSKKLDLKTKKRDLGTAAGFAIDNLKHTYSLRALDEAYRKVKVKDPEVSAHAALQMLRMWTDEKSPATKQKHLKRLRDMFFSGRKPRWLTALFRHVGDTLQAHTPCGNCGGTGKVTCELCDRGRVLERCRTCNGTGREEDRRGVRNCSKCSGAGDVTGGKCAQCTQGISDCSSCTGKAWVAPPISKLAVFESCATCGGKGRVFSPLTVHCVDCVGLGQIPKAP